MSTSGFHPSSLPTHLLHPHHAAAPPPPHLVMQHSSSITCFVVRPKVAGAASSSVACFSIQHIFPSSSSSSSSCFIVNPIITQLQLKRNGRFGNKARAQLVAGAEAVDDAVSASPQFFEEEDADDAKRSVSLLKVAAKTRKVPPTEVFMALRSLEKAKLDPSTFLTTIGGTQSPGRTWMLVFTASDKKVVSCQRERGFAAIFSIIKMDMANFLYKQLWRLGCFLTFSVHIQLR